MPLVVCVFWCVNCFKCNYALLHLFFLSLSLSVSLSVFSSLCVPLVRSCSFFLQLPCLLSHSISLARSRTLALSRAQALTYALALALSHCILTHFQLSDTPHSSHLLQPGISDFSLLKYGSSTDSKKISQTKNDPPLLLSFPPGCCRCSSQKSLISSPKPKFNLECQRFWH